VATFLRLVGAFAVLVLAITFGTVGGCLVSFAAGYTLPAPGQLGLTLLGALVGLVAGALLVAHMLRHHRD
jgi:hypothetical protein